jgi:hypothetical protein
MPFDNSFNYRSVIGKLNYLEKATRSDISFAVHQCARFVSDPKVEHGEAVRWLRRYLKGTRDKGTIMKPVPDKELKVYVDASFCATGIRSKLRRTATLRDRGTDISYPMPVVPYYGNLNSKRR